MNKKLSFTGGGGFNLPQGFPREDYFRLKKLVEGWGMSQRQILSLALRVLEDEASYDISAKYEAAVKRDV